MIIRLLTRAHLRARWRRYAAVGVVFLVGLVAFLFVASLLSGARSALVSPLEATIAGPVRATHNSTDLGSGARWSDYRQLQADVERLTGAEAVPRFESTYITVEGTQFERWSAGLLVGIIPQEDLRVADYSPFLIWGQRFDGPFVEAPDGRAHVPLVIGRPAAERLNLTLGAGPDFGRPLTITSGHTISSTLVPLTIEAVVVGVFETGLEPLDKFTAFIPIQHARALAGYAEEDPVANALLVAAPDVEAADRALESAGWKSVTSEEYAFTYMGSMMVVLYGAAFLALALFLAIILVWTIHQSGQFLAQDRPVLASLRAIGIPIAAIRSSYAGLLTLTFTIAGLAALVVLVVAVPLLPPLSWGLSGLKARIELPLLPSVYFGTTLGAAALGGLTAYWTARRVGREDILQALRR